MEWDQINWVVNRIVNAEFYNSSATFSNGIHTNTIAIRINWLELHDFVANST
jgi:hypothetical protein